ncbi:MAG: hypothetical protein Kow0025_25970 [Thermodesulfovibrionales bacterium]
MEKFVSQLSWGLLIIACLTLGLAPFNPPHIWEKLQMLARGRLVRPLDWFDLVLHAIPWALLLLKVFYSLRKGP